MFVSKKGDVFEKGYYNLHLSCGHEQNLNRSTWWIIICSFESFLTVLCDIIASKKLACCRDCDMLLCMCSILIPGLANLSQDWLLRKKSSSTNPEMPKKAIISVFKGYLVHFGSVKRQNSTSLRRSALSHILCCQYSYKRIKCGHLAFISVY